MFSCGSRQVGGAEGKQAIPISSLMKLLQLMISFIWEVVLWSRFWSPIGWVSKLISRALHWTQKLKTPRVGYYYYTQLRNLSLQHEWENNATQFQDHRNKSWKRPTRVLLSSPSVSMDHGFLCHWLRYFSLSPINFKCLRWQTPLLILEDKSRK